MLMTAMECLFKVAVGLIVVAVLGFLVSLMIYVIHDRWDK